MIVSSRTQAEWQAMAAFLHERAGVQPSIDLKLIGWVSDGKLVVVVGLHGFLGSVAQIHVAFAEGWNFAPRQMLREVFRYAFIEAKREMLVGIVNSLNERAMKMDAHLGFTELFRLHGMHDDGGDVVLVSMKKSECRYLNEPEAEPLVTEEVGTRMNPFKLLWCWLDFCTLYGGGGKGGGQVQAAQAQSEASKEIATGANYANRPTINTPWGQQTWETSSQIDPATGQPVTGWETNITLSPEQQAALDSQMRVQQGKSQAAETLLGQATGAFQKPFDWDSLTKVSNVGDAQANAFQKMSAMLQPGREQEQAGQRTRLANLGLSENDEAAQRAQAGLSSRFASQDQGLLAQALQEGRSTVGLEQGQRQAQIAEEAQRRGMTLNELNALLTGQQVQMPGMPQAPAAAMGQAPDLLAAQNAKNAGGTDWGAIAGTVGMGAAMVI